MRTRVFDSFAFSMASRMLPGPELSFDVMAIVGIGGAAGAAADGESPGLELVSASDGCVSAAAAQPAEGSAQSPTTRNANQVGRWVRDCMT